jgi:hypothetical protein
MTRGTDARNRRKQKNRKQNQGDGEALMMERGRRDGLLPWPRLLRPRPRQQRPTPLKQIRLPMQKLRGPLRAPFTNTTSLRNRTHSGHAAAGALMRIGPALGCSNHGTRKDLKLFRFHDGEEHARANTTLRNTRQERLSTPAPPGCAAALSACFSVLRLFDLPSPLLLFPAAASFLASFASFASLASFKPREPPAAACSSFASFASFPVRVRLPWTASGTFSAFFSFASFADAAEPAAAPSASASPRLVLRVDGFCEASVAGSGAVRFRPRPGLPSSIPPVAPEGGLEQRRLVVCPHSPPLTCELPLSVTCSREEPPAEQRSGAAPGAGGGIGRQQGWPPLGARRSARERSNRPRGRTCAGPDCRGGARSPRWSAVLPTSRGSLAPPVPPCLAANCGSDSQKKKMRILKS